MGTGLPQHPFRRAWNFSHRCCAVANSGTMLVQQMNRVAASASSSRAVGLRHLTVARPAPAVCAAAATEAPPPAAAPAKKYHASPLTTAAPSAYAIVEIGGSQLFVEPGKWYTVNRLKGAEVGSQLKLGRVLAVKEGGKFTAGRPYLETATVEAKLIEELRGPKVIVYKMKPKKHYRRKRGHRCASCGSWAGWGAGRAPVVGGAVVPCKPWAAVDAHACMQGTSCASNACAPWGHAASSSTHAPHGAHTRMHTCTHADGCPPQAQAGPESCTTRAGASRERALCACAHHPCTQPVHTHVSATLRLAGAGEGLARVCTLVHACTIPQPRASFGASTQSGMQPPIPSQHLTAAARNQRHMVVSTVRQECAVCALQPLPGAWLRASQHNSLHNHRHTPRRLSLSLNSLPALRSSFTRRQDLSRFMVTKVSA